jgi:hypothetical protein
VKLGIENRKETIAAAVLGLLLLLVVAYEFMPSSSTNASTATTANLPAPSATSSARPTARRVSGTAAPGTKARAPQSLDPTLHLDQLALTEQIKYEGSGRNIFVARADTEIPKPLGPGVTDKTNAPIYQPPAVNSQPPIPLKFFGFANQPGEAKRIFLSKAEDVFIAGEGEIVDRRYKVVRISSASVEIQDLVVSGPPQSIPLTQEKP